MSLAVKFSSARRLLTGIGRNDNPAMKRRNLK
jgi:hypothetical protein